MARIRRLSLLQGPYLDVMRPRLSACLDNKFNLAIACFDGIFEVDAMVSVQQLKLYRLTLQACPFKHDLYII